MQAIDLGQRHRLDHAEALGRPVAQIVLGLVQGAAMKELPGGIAKIEKRHPVVVDDKAPVVADPEHRHNPS
jgi:hypothetical protein